MLPSSGSSNRTRRLTACISVSRRVWGKLRCHASSKEGRCSGGVSAACGQSSATSWPGWKARSTEGPGNVGGSGRGAVAGCKREGGI